MSTTDKGGFNPAITSITTTPPRLTAPFGVWIAYYQDRSGLAIFESEIEALRRAVEHSMQVAYVKYGADVWESIGGAR